MFVGTFAYSMYLIHAPLLQVLWQTLFVPLHARPLMLLAAYWLVGTPLIVGCAYLFFLAFERPFLNTRRKETLAETARDAALAPAPVTAHSSREVHGALGRRLPDLDAEKLGAGKRGRLSS